MKKLSLLLVLILVSTLLFGCNGAQGNTDGISEDGVVWSDTAADKNLVGAWEIEGSTEDEIRLFTEDCKIKIVRGSVSIQGDVTYGIDTEGNHKYLSDFYYMAGELNYVADGDTAIFVREDGVTQTLKKVEYKAPELEVYKKFNAENPLVGTWHNDEYNDTYVFNADGTAVYELKDTENACLYHIDYTYMEDDGYILLTFDAGDGIEQSKDSYKITGDTLNIIGLGEYTRK